IYDRACSRQIKPFLLFFGSGMIFFFWDRWGLVAFIDCLILGLSANCLTTCLFILLSVMFLDLLFILVNNMCQQHLIACSIVVHNINKKNAN
ncbi:hypothetical protein ACJX0J_020708, partial [Zea mays]